MPFSGVQTCARSEEHTSELQSHDNLVCRLLLEKKIKENEQSPPRRPRACHIRASRLTVRRGAALCGAGRRFPASETWVRFRDMSFFFKRRGTPRILPLSPTQRFPD